MSPTAEAGYIAFAKGRSLDMFLQQPGCLGVLFVNTGNRVHTVLSLWESRQDVERLSKSVTYLETAEALMKTGFIEEMLPVQVHEIEGGVVRCPHISEIVNSL